MASDKQEPLGAASMEPKTPDKLEDKPRRLLRGSMIHGSNVLTTNEAVFSPADVGKDILVEGAGNGGKELYSKIAAYTTPYRVALADEAVNTVNGTGIVLGAIEGK